MAQDELCLRDRINECIELNYITYASSAYNVLAILIQYAFHDEAARLNPVLESKCRAWDWSIYMGTAPFHHKVMACRHHHVHNWVHILNTGQLNAYTFEWGDVKGPRCDPNGLTYV